MDEGDVLRILTSLERPLTDRLDTYRQIPGALNIRFRGSPLGRFKYCTEPEGYIADASGTPWNYALAKQGIRGTTYCAPWMESAIDYVLRRTDATKKVSRYDPGRYDPNTGRKDPRYRYGFPVVMAINIEPYEPDLIEALTAPGELQIYGPVSMSDIFILFSPEKDLLKDIIGGTDAYDALCLRLHHAIHEKPNA